MLVLISPLIKGFFSPCIKALMDDLFLMAPSQHQTQEPLDPVTVVVSWAQMSLKAPKSRYLMMKKGKVLQEANLTISVHKFK